MVSPPVPRLCLLHPAYLAELCCIALLRAGWPLMHQEKDRMLGKALGELEQAERERRDVSTRLDDANR